VLEYWSIGVLGGHEQLSITPLLHYSITPLLHPPRPHMFTADQYQLLDFGDGRKLERFGPFLMDRPATARCARHRSQPSLWSTAHARYNRVRGEQGIWVPADAVPRSWTIRHATTTLEVRPNPFGHVGVFPEQAENWDWISRQVSRAGRSLKVLNLFAYTGGGTLTAAACGAEVVHVDAARNVVDWARRNAQLSGLGGSAIRWIVEDARKFVRRELQRGNRYHAVILDPPSYGHGPRGEAWRIARDLLPLLASCAELTRGERVFVLLTCHSPGLGPAQLRGMLAESGLSGGPNRAVARPLDLVMPNGLRLPSGVVAHWPE